MGEVASIVYKPLNATPAEEAYTRIPLQEAQLVVEHGIDGDAKGGKNRQLNIMSAETVQVLAQEGFHAEPGQLGEQILIAGLDVDALPVGTRLQLGASACVELTEPRTGCGKFERYQGRKREEVANRIGMMARVVANGTIRVGDPVRLAEAAEV